MKDLEITTRSWLKNATDRQGGREKRSQNKPANTEQNEEV